MRIKRSVSAALIVALAASFTVLSASGAGALSNSEGEFVRLINKERSARGKQSLDVKSDLVEVARRHSARMAKEGRIWHNKKLASEVGGNWKLLGENVGMGPSVDSLHKAFMDSTGHRANILHREYNQIGVGVVRDGDLLYVTQVFAKRTRTAKKTVVVRRTSDRAPQQTPEVRTQAQAQAPVPVRHVSKPSAPKPAMQEARTVDVLLRMVGYDAEEVDPATGYAAAP